MKDKHLFHPKEAADALGVSVKTIQRWDQAGKLRAVRTAGHQRRIPLKEIERLLRPAEPQAECCALYARVSRVRQGQDGNLARQTERLKEVASARSYKVVAVITEQASSLNEKWNGMNKLLALIEEPAVEVVLIEYPDRLMRFGLQLPRTSFELEGIPARSA